jgi:hypothetical protein
LETGSREALISARTRKILIDKLKCFSYKISIPDLVLNISLKQGEDFLQLCLIFIL